MLGAPASLKGPASQSGCRGPQPSLWAKLSLSAGFLPVTYTQDTPWSPSQFEVTTFLLKILLSPIVLGMKFRPLPPLLAHSCSAFLASLWFLEYSLRTSGPLYLLCMLPGDNREHSLKYSLFGVPDPLTSPPAGLTGHAPMTVPQIQSSVKARSATSGYKCKLLASDRDV